MKTIWSPDAIRLRREITLYVGQRDPDAARKLAMTFQESANKLCQFPNLGRPGRVEGTRELSVHKHYFIVYELSEEEVTILAIWHTARKYPPFTE